MPRAGHSCRDGHRPGLFDAYLMVDWSAAAAPARGPNSIWIARSRRDAGRLRVSGVTNPPTRHEATAVLARALEREAAAGRRVLVGWDFPQGYPAGFGQALGLRGRGEPWLRIWKALGGWIEDDPANRNNRFEVARALDRALAPPGVRGPFWVARRSTASRGLPGRKPPFPFETRSGRRLGERRMTERALQARGLHPKPVWQLHSPGSAGGQALVGIPRVAALRWHPALRAVSRVWPFETGFTDAVTPPRGPWIVHAEMWPGVVGARVRAAPARGARPGSVPPPRDAVQVRLMCRWAAGLDARGRLGAAFARPAGLSPGEARRAQREEGWILGA